jgi:phosphoenolpyruvate phosphomutase
MLSSRFRSLLKNPKPFFIMEAHNGISAKIVEKTGFDAIWGSGLTLSGSNAVRDSNEMSWTQLIDNLEKMSDAVNIPILVDGDTGFGNYNNARRLVRKLEERKIAGVCIEDKLFPKTNSFIDSEAQTLADRIEHANKITACKEYQTDPNFSVVARLESLIVGAGIDDALLRAETYTAAGADAILVHSKKSNFNEINDFCNQFRKINDQCKNIPLVVVPTKYYNTPLKTMTDAGVSNFIWANHNLRASIHAMENVSKQIFDEQSLANVEHSVSTVNDIFDYQEDSKLRKHDKYYLGNKQVKYNFDKLIAKDVTNETAVFKGELTEKKTKTKINPHKLRKIFTDLDITYTVGVPDSTLKEYFDNDKDLVVAHEGISMSMAAGYALETYKIPLIYLQNSGFGNVLNPLLSLNGIYKLPSIIMMGWRGHDQKDEIQHNAQGRLTPKLLRLYNIPYVIVNGNETEAELTKMVGDIKKLAIKDKTTTCMLFRTECFENIAGKKPQSVGHMNPDHVMDTIVSSLSGTKVITSTGFNTRRFYDAMVKQPEFAKKNKYMFCPGSMGHALSIGIGASYGTDKRIVVVDGGFHMHSGTANSVHNARNMTHIILDNSSHESVGQQKTCGTKVTNLAHLLKQYSYDSVTEVKDCEELKAKINSTAVGKHVIVCPTHLSDTKFGRPPMKPSDIEKYVDNWRS